jgi:hypothetical protein
MEDKATTNFPRLRIGDSKSSIRSTSTSSQLLVATPNGIVQPREPHTVQTNPNSSLLINQFQSNPNARLSLHKIDKTQVLQPSAVANQEARRDKGMAKIHARD